MQIVNWKNFFRFLEMEAPKPKKSCDWESEPITEAQKKYLRSLGIGHTGMRTKGQASLTIKVAEKRKREGFATPGQMWAMSRIGYETVYAWTFVQAKRYLKEDGYQTRRPPERCTYQIVKKYW